MRSPHLTLSVLALACAASARSAEPVQAPELPAVEVLGHYDNGVGSSDAASAGTVTRRLIANRPALRPAEVLEFVPGVVVTQHSGDGKANQYFLRGFNLDHGTDFATFVDGMPINSVSHAHGQGYTDLNFLIPELINRIDYNKGPYRAQDGDFANAGSARIGLVDKLAAHEATVTIGERGYLRTLLAGPLGTPAAAGGHDTLYAVEAAKNDGPWTTPEGIHRFSGALRHTIREGDARLSLTALAYSAHWRSTDQIPARAVDDGSLGRYDAVDATDGGRTSRASLSANGRLDTGDGGWWQANAYAVSSRLKLWSNFTYFLDNPVDGDQFEQAEHRTTLGANLQRRFKLPGEDQALTLGADLRHDRLSPVGLYDTTARQRRSVTQEAQVRETGWGLWAEHQNQWTPWLRHVAGLRFDKADFEVDSSVAGNSGKAHDDTVSPKLSLIFGPWADADHALLKRTEAFVNLGQGFHSNDARGTTASVDAKSGDPVDRVPGLVKSRGGELGLRTEPLPGWQASLAWWRLNLGSELVYVGDAGTTEATRASSRHGIEINQHLQLDKMGLAGWLLDLDLSASKARYRGEDTEGAGDRVPGAVNHVASLGLTYSGDAPWFGHFQLRHFGPRDLVEDGSVRSKATTLGYLRVGYRVSPKLRVALDVFNLFNERASDIDYLYESRLASEPDAVTGRHFHPVEPRSLRLTVTASF